MSNQNEPIKVEEMLKQEKSEMVGERKTAFFITPLGSDDSSIRRNTNGVINAVIRPVLSKHDIFLVPPHEIDSPGNITRQIISQILTADLVIADLTGLNPNVMYELAVRHARRLPVIVICQHGTTLPFDIAAERTFFYYNDMAGTVQLFDQLDKTIPKALNDTQPDNPVYNGLQQATIIQKISEESDDPVRSYIIEKLSVVDELNSLVKSLVTERTQTRSSRYNDSLLEQLKKSTANLAGEMIAEEWHDPSLEPVDINTLKIGDFIVQQKFGPGIVKHIEIIGNERKVTIHFEREGNKTLLFDFAKDRLKRKPTHF